MTTWNNTNKPSTSWDGVNKVDQGYQEFSLLIDDTYSFLIDDTNELLAQPESTGTVWTSYSKI